jgi:hypothetical protein
MIFQANASVRRRKSVSENQMTSSRLEIDIEGQQNFAFNVDGDCAAVGFT